MRVCFVFLISLFLSACAPTIENAKQAQLSAKSCCKDFGKFPYENFTSNNQPLNFNINLASPYFSFDSGGSYFKAFQFESPDLKNKTLELKSYIQTLGFGRENYFFNPAVLLLDSNFKVINKSDNPAEMVRNDLFSAGDHVLYKSLSLTGDEKYLIIYTTPKLLEYQTPYESTQSTYAAGVVLTNDVKSYILNGPVGTLRIQLK